MERYRPQNNDAKHTSDQKDMPKKARSPNGPDPLIVDAPPLSPEDVPMEASGPVTLDDFVAYLPKHSYIFRPTGEVWEAGGVNARIPPIKKDFPATRWLDRNRGVEQITWSPGEPTDIKGKLIRDGGWIPARRGVSVQPL